MVDAGRARRMSARIKQIVASTIETQIKDPRLGMVTITDVRLTGDLHDATIFYTVLGDAEQRVRPRGRRSSRPRGSCAARSGGAPGCGSRRRWRSSSTSCPNRPIQIDDLLERAARADAEVQQARVGAVPAGEADPYRQPARARRRVSR